MRKRIRHHRHVYPDLDITAFMNLMVILVPFLLITAVFSRVTVLDLYLPPESEASAAANNKFRLEIVLRKDQITVLEAATGLKKQIDKQDGSFNMAMLKDNLFAIKKQFPSKEQATILAEPDVEYDLLVQVMDAIRMREMKQGQQVNLIPLFPGLSIGDAPEKS